MIFDPDTTKKYISRYRHKATVVRQIHSDKAESKKRLDLIYTVLTVIFGAATTFIGFMGSDRLTEGISIIKATVGITTSSVVGAPSTALEKATFDLIFAVVVLLLFITSLLNLVYRWKEDHTSHFQSVVKLTQYLNWLDETEFLLEVDIHRMTEVRSRYQGIIEHLPPNSRRDYLKAKRRLSAKAPSPQASESPEIDSTNGEERFYKSLIHASPILMSILRAAHEVSPRLWLGGGAIRNHFWDVITGRLTKHDDFDIVYFDDTDLDEETDRRLEKKIRMLLPESLSISVKNQARMHMVTGESASKSLVESVSNWPETATAVAARLVDGRIELVAPHGLRDISTLMLKPTPFHAIDRKTFDRRVESKRWLECWPELRLPVVSED